MVINDKIKDSIRLYVRGSDDFQKIKILMNPFEYLRNLKNSGYFSITQKFISTEEELKFYINCISNILIQGYTNYNSSIVLPKKIYRSISKSELNYLLKNSIINELYSTSKDLDTSIGYTLETSGAEWIPQEHFILEIMLGKKIPFVDVDKDASEFSIEPNELILVPPFNLRKLKLIRPGGAICEFYSPDSIPIYSVKLGTMPIAKVNVSNEKLETMYEEIAKDIHVYGKIIEDYLCGKINDKFINDKNYVDWAKRLKKFIMFLSVYINSSTYEEDNRNKVKKLY